MSETLTSMEDHHEPELYEIRLKGHLGSQWIDWFDSLIITLEENGDTLLTGPLIDQAALHGLLKKVRDLGMPLISVFPAQFNESHPYRSKKEKKMNTTVGSPHGTYRKTAVIVGILFIIGTVAGILSGVVTAPITAGSTYPLNISASETQWLIGTLLILVMGFPLAMIPIMLYPIFKKHNEVLVLGAVLFRGVLEMVCYIIPVISQFLLLSVSQIHGTTGAADVANLQALGSVLIATTDWSNLILGLVFSIGGMMIYVLFYQTRLIPRWLSGWGFIGAILYFIAHLEGIFGAQQILSFNTDLGFLMAPLAIQEMVFAVWMIAKGFNPSAIAALFAKTE